MREPGTSLPNLAPPPGGLTRLRNSVEQSRRRLAPVWGGLAVAACSITVLALVAFPGALQRYRTRAALVQAMHQAVQPVRPGELRVIDGAALALESGQSGVRLYLVQSRRAGKAVSQR